MFKKPMVSALRAPGAGFLTQANHCNISLNPGRLYLPSGEEVLVDAADLDRVRALTWHAHQRDNLIYAVHRPCLGGNRRARILLHRFILEPPPGAYIDHRNGNGLDNRRANLRLCDHSQNMHNACRSGRALPRGVSIRDGKFRARIRGIHIGLFVSAHEAALAWDAAARKLYGEFARLNFPDIGSEL